MPNVYSDLPENIRQFGRTIDMLGLAGFTKLQNSYVVVVGQGGVGCHAAAVLIRSGLGKLKIVDFDDLSLSSLNRHVIGTQEDVGTAKGQLMLEHLQAINPEAEIIWQKEFFHNDTATKIFDEKPDFVIDAIDSFTPKVALLKYCSEENIKVVASMGASARIDATKVQVADIKDTHTCPLARVVRRKLRQHGVASGIECVFSDESPAKTLEPDTSDMTYWRGRMRNRLPSLGIVPGVFGYTLAGLVIQKLSGYKVDQ